MTKDEIMIKLADLLVEHFEVERTRIRPQARLYDDLDIDSIDSVEVIAQLKPLAGKRLRPEFFRSVRTVQDVVDTLHGVMHDGTAAR
jgi:acyl carrier protein